MRNIFTEHPKSLGETYFEHMKFAMKFGLQMIIGGGATLIHAIFPFLFPRTGSHFLLKMTYFFIERMPEIENRVLGLSQLIEKKRALFPQNGETRE